MKQHNELEDSIDYLTGFYKGVVERRLSTDPQQIGRVKVRIIGVNSSDVPIDSLLWAEVMGSTAMGGNIAGIGVSSVLREGAYVWLFFEEGDFNRPVIFGTMIGTQSAANEEGFQAETPGEYIAARMGESDLHPLARADSTAKIGTVTAHGAKTGAAVTGISNTPANGGSWDEPAELSTSAKYPDNNVIETHSGHIIEMDDTAGNERIHILHRTGSYIEMRPDGTIVAKSVADRYEVVAGNSSENIIGNEMSTTNGNVDKLVNGSTTKQIDGTRDEKVTGLITIDADGKMLINGMVKIDGSLEVTGKISSGGGVTSTGEVADSTGNLSSLRQAFDGHNHLYNPGPGGPTPTAIPTTTDPVARDSDYVW